MINAARSAADIGVYFFLAYCACLLGEITFHHFEALTTGTLIPFVFFVPMPAGFRRPFARATQEA